MGSIFARLVEKPNLQKIFENFQNFSKENWEKFMSLADF